MAATADIVTPEETLGTSYAPMAADTKVFEGTLVCRNAAGYAVPAADTAGLIFAGIALEKVDNTDAGTGETTTAGGRDVNLITEGCYLFTCTGLGINDVGAKLYAVDDQTVTLGGSVTNGVYIGTVERYISGTRVVVRLDLGNRREKRGNTQLFTFTITGTNAAALDLSTIAASYGGADIYVDEVLWMNAITTSSGDFADRQVITTDFTLSAGVLTCVGDKSSLTLQMAVLGRLED